MVSRHSSLIRLTLALLMILAMSGQVIPADPASQNTADLLQQAGASYRAGDLEAAARDWTEAAARYHKLQDARAESHALAQAAVARQGLGQYQAAVKQLKQARTLADTVGDRGNYANLTQQLGAAFLLLPDPAAAEPLLNEALQLARTRKDTRLEATVLDSHGKLQQLKGNTTAALEHYRRCLTLAGKNDDNALLARAAASASQLDLETKDYQHADGHLAQAGAAASRLPDSHDNAYLLMRIARLQQQLAAALPARSAALTRDAYTDLQEAARIATELDDPRAESWAWGYLGELYETHGRINEAMDFTRRAIFVIQEQNAPELLFRWEWQQARLFKAQDDNAAAIRAYRKAITTLQSVRSELAASLENSHESYHRLVGQLFLEYADLLLQEGAASGDPEKIQQTLIEARDTVELLKTVELQDYFQDDCVSLARSRVKGLEETLSPRTAVIYPILFRERTELLLSTSEGMSRHTVPVPAERMTEVVHDFRRKLEKRSTRQYMHPARQLYDWLIRPLEAELAAHNIDTLVIVPDAALRTIPLAALHDGKQFLIEKYALASTPSLELTDPRPIRTQTIDLLLGGLTEPVQGFPGLPNVATELEQIRALYGGRLLENSSFSKSAFEEQLVDHPYNVVHIASHGKFEGKVSDSYILTYDGKLSMDDLEQYIGLSEVRVEQPVELLTLSACQTAVGDEWAGLGLASIAIKAGARSALATLWYVNDQVTSTLVTAFYRHLGEPGMTKARALQQAQLEILADRRYRHPAYWAPYLLIGNWL